MLSSLIKPLRISIAVTGKTIGKYERHISTGALVIGFVIDYLTLTRTDRFLDNLVIISYLLIAAGGILTVHFYETTLRSRIAPDGTRRSLFFDWLRVIAPTVIQFAFGGLFSAFTIFYTRSAAFSVSWPAVFLIFGMMIANEFFQEWYRRLTVQVSILYFALFSYLIFLVPILIGMIGPWVFFVSGMVSLILIALFLNVVWRMIPLTFRRAKIPLITSVLLVFGAINTLYYLNFIPPIPLSLQQARVAHMVERSSANTYHLRVEPWSILDYVRRGDVYHRYKNEPVYVFSSVFAPSDLRARIVHRWQYWDNKRSQWETRSTIAFPVVGGRTHGYRGYSRKRAVEPGLWRVDIETASGLVIGRIDFSVVDTDKRPDLEKLVL